MNYDNAAVGFCYLVRIRLILGLLSVVLACGLPPGPAEFRREVSSHWSEDDGTDPFAGQLFAAFQVQGGEEVQEVDEVEEVEAVKALEAVGDPDESLRDEMTTTNEEAPEVLFFFFFFIIQ